MALFVAVAHTGQLVQLNVHSSQRVEALQQAIVRFTEVPVADQIVMLAGIKLDAAKPLSYYKLPMADPDEPVYVFCKSYLKPGADIPPAKTLPCINPKVPPAIGTASSVAGHPLTQSSNSLVRALPGLEAVFAHHVAAAAAYWESSTERLQRCRQLLSEMEVQSRAADAATGNVDVHYQQISNIMDSFMSRYTQQCTHHAQLLASFSEDQALLETMTLHPVLQQQAGPAKWLSDLPAAVKARDAATSCRKYHGQFAQKVSQLESLYHSVKLDMEGLIMQQPSVDLDALGGQVSEGDGWVAESEAIVQVLQKDLSTLKQVVEQAVRQSIGSASSTASNNNTGSGQASGRAGGQQPMDVSGSSGPAWTQLLDKCQAVHAMATAHEQQQLPRVAGLDASLAVLEENCIKAKKQMTADVISMLQRISLQQSKIRDMRGRLAAFDALLQRQASLFLELQPLGRLPAAYRAVLAECERRRSWHQLKTGQAAEFVDQLISQYQQEYGRRQYFVQQVERYIPSEVLEAAGLLEPGPPPLPTVTVPPAPASLMPVSLQEIQALPLAPPAVSLSMAAMSQLLYPAAASMAQDTAGSSKTEKQTEESIEGDGVHNKEQSASTTRQTYVPPLPDPTSMHKLEMENARLRAELADMLANMSLQRLQQATAVSSMATFAPQASTITASAAAQPYSEATTPGQSHAGHTPSTGNPLLGRSSSWRRTPSHSAAATAVPIPSGIPGSPSVHAAQSGLSFTRSHSMTPNVMSQQPSTGTSPAVRQTILSGMQAASISPRACGGPTAAAGGSSMPAAGLLSAQASLPLPLQSAPPSGSYSLPQQPPSTTAATVVPLPHASSFGVSHANVLHAVHRADSAGDIAAPDVTVAKQHAVAALQQAVVMKEQYCTALQHELRALTDRIGSYESRIKELERVVTRQTTEQQDSSGDNATAATGGGYGIGSEEHQQQGDILDMQIQLGVAGNESQPQQQHQVRHHPWHGSSRPPATLHTSVPGPSSSSTGLPAQDSESYDPLNSSSGCLDMTTNSGSTPPNPYLSNSSHLGPHRAVLDTTHLEMMLPTVARVGRHSLDHGGSSTTPHISASAAQGLLGPIALAALGGSRGPTPEPILNANTQALQRDDASSPMPLLLGHHHLSNMPDKFSPWQLATLPRHDAVAVGAHDKHTMDSQPRAPAGSVHAPVTTQPSAGRAISLKDGVAGKTEAAVVASLQPCGLAPGETAGVNAAGAPVTMTLLHEGTQLGLPESIAVMPVNDPLAAATSMPSPSTSTTASEVVAAPDQAGSNKRGVPVISDDSTTVAAACIIMQTSEGTSMQQDPVGLLGGTASHDAAVEVDANPMVTKVSGSSGPESMVTCEDVGEGIEIRTDRDEGDEDSVPDIDECMASPAKCQQSEQGYVHPSAEHVGTMQTDMEEPRSWPAAGSGLSDPGNESTQQHSCDQQTTA